MMPIFTAIYASIINHRYFQLPLVMVIKPINQTQISVRVAHYVNGQVKM